MQLKILREASISVLKKDIEKNKDRYLSNESWLDDYFKEKGMDQYYLSTNIYVDDFQLIIGDKTLDAQNAVIVHKAMKNLLPIHARDEKIWTYLTHTKYYKYMKSRWEIFDSEKDQSSRIESRYFFQGNNGKIVKTSTIPYVRNGLSRLWWAGYIVYDKDSDNPYEYINELFISQDMFVGLCERDIAKNKDMVLAILKATRKYNLQGYADKTILIRNILKDINFSAGLIMYDGMSKEQIQSKVDEIFEINIMMKHLKLI